MLRDRFADPFFDHLLKTSVHLSFSVPPARPDPRASSEESCVSCVQGKYSLTLPAVSEISCLECVQGKFSTALAVISEERKVISEESCVSCGQGKYSLTLPVVSEMSCLTCVQGKYSTCRYFR